MGVNPKDPNDDCSNSATLLLGYITINFFYNILLLAITKRGSAVLLVMSQVSFHHMSTSTTAYWVSYTDELMPLLRLLVVSSGIVLTYYQHLLHSEATHGR